MLPDRGPQGEAMFVRTTVVFEVRSGDETYEKLPFYAAVVSKAVVVVERDTKAIQMFALSGERFVLVPPSRMGWASSRPSASTCAPEFDRQRLLAPLRLREGPETERTI